jgi:CheY-like chemotaxis protein/anti-sigma regulatory factor (Ser/Thr protein kinase)
MATALVVDDSKVDQHLAGTLLKNRAQLDVLYADDGAAALQVMAVRKPDVVVTDMQMPELDGLGLVEAVRRMHPSVPVIVMTAHGSEEAAAQALRAGAASYVPKKYVSRDLTEIVQRVLAITGIHHQQRLAVECLSETASRFVLDNDSARIHPLIHFLRDDLIPMGICDQTAMMRLGVALEEALANAICHGNLEADSALRESSIADYLGLIDERRGMEPYASRRVFVTATATREGVRYVVRDEGKGFDRDHLPDPTDPKNLCKASGRGLLLIRAFVDEVSFNEAGNEITLYKKREEPAAIPVKAEY